MRKSLSLQAELSAEFGTCVFDVTLDCEDGAPVGGEAEHATLVAELVLGAAAGARVAARVHPVEHPSFEQDVQTIVGRAGARLSHIMVPKVESVADLNRAAQALDDSGAPALALHALIESPQALRQLDAIAAHPRLQSLSFGLMDFVSAHAGLIPHQAMSLAGQFSHPLVVRAKLEIAAACHAYGKVSSHCVVTEFSDTQALSQAARRAAREFGCARMWSIHPAQIRPIINAFAPEASELEMAAQLLAQAEQAQWAPIQFGGVLHDRASYRYFWQVLERAFCTGQALPEPSRAWFTSVSQRQVD